MDPSMTAISSPRPEGIDWTAGLGSYGSEPLTIRPLGLDPSSTPIPVKNACANKDRWSTFGEGVYR
jgi:hypothetical protein